MEPGQDMKALGAGAASGRESMAFHSPTGATAGAGHGHSTCPQLTRTRMCAHPSVNPPGAPQENGPQIPGHTTGGP